MADERAVIRTAIYGSCVSRDTFEYLDQDRFTLVRYIARQSLISAFSPPSPVPAEWLERLDSPFQRRMLADDFASSLPTFLQEHGNDIDLLLWDLTDERLGVYELPDGRYVTRSVEGIQCGVDERLGEEARSVPLGSPEHLRLWGAALNALTVLVADLPRRPQVLVVAPPWAEHDSEGNPAPSSFGLHAEQANVAYEPYVDAARRLGTVLTMDDHLTETSADHPWGIAPFHYAKAVYARLARQIETTRLHR
ncbi:DUF6270 domain-containing protein [Sanguibacter suaedae]|uniref:Uncharacterized protein n=1 Tax=Sanguibacter suaedae TaxID=2795737 RepID=A0A934M9F6_9MICO|nr:DUF6270 domain-containing protein [Sanguibacter suaedae]MBI9114613.1 hypothetical protein [Sanguibacter suaedae]